MKTWLTLLLLVAAMPSLLHAETRSIAVRISRGHDSALRVSIYSEEKAEDVRGVSIAEARAIIVKARGWGSSAFVFVLPDLDTRLDQYLHILEAISLNPELELGAVEPSNAGDSALKRFGFLKERDGDTK